MSAFRKLAWPCYWPSGLSYQKKPQTNWRELVGWQPIRKRQELQAGDEGFWMMLGGGQPELSSWWMAWRGTPPGSRCSSNLAADTRAALSRRLPTHTPGRLVVTFAGSSCYLAPLLPDSGPDKKDACEAPLYWWWGCPTLDFAAGNAKARLTKL